MPPNDGMAMGTMMSEPRPVLVGINTNRAIDGINSTDAGGFMRVDTRSNGGARFQWHSSDAGSTALNQIMTLSSDGKLGLGVSGGASKAKLEINGAASYTTTSNSIYFANNSTTGSGVHGPGLGWSLSLYSSNAIAGSHLIAHSDKRIKSVIGTSNSESDLNTLMQIEVTDYRLKDTISNGLKLQKKVIAQQLKEVYPIAVDNSITRAVPDIYKKAELIDGWVMLDTDLKVGERVKIITKTAEEVLEILEVKEDGFRVDLSGLILRPRSGSTQGSNSADVFVYGREVDDFHTVDYDAIAMLNVSATQELARKLIKSEKRAELMEKQNEELKALLTQLSDRMQAVEAQLEKNNGSEYSAEK